ncbi:hypothetical protein N656DRAFT_28044 [Canariomyces notabilis]|uniref:Uncharacterized protein n=1 Tax=Canariomyces notabilis TaxID=2074819 RepID=A0AAN6YX45_9PEZI|nr:hypothetical protein N656DRAFT_28044 [Canariomyces arenarius]
MFACMEGGIRTCGRLTCPTTNAPGSANTCVCMRYLSFPSALHSPSCPGLESTFRPLVIMCGRRSTSECSEYVRSIHPTLFHNRMSNDLLALEALCTLGW